MKYREIATLYTDLISERDATSIITELEVISSPIRKKCSSVIYVNPEAMNPEKVDASQAITFALLPCKFELVDLSNKRSLHGDGYFLILNKNMTQIENFQSFRLLNFSEHYTLLSKSI
ncbi:hypothetical protein [Leptospira vanthielii]|uniref:hypothetical protein n=1 Tax=Leptospira vanthielii TaxID=293085 RepID=UPI000308D979|nr:hypothetical protein [Leptospira vanthielii]